MLKFFGDCCGVFLVTQSCVERFSDSYCLLLQRRLKNLIINDVRSEFVEHAYSFLLFATEDILFWICIQRSKAFAKF